MDYLTMWLEKLRGGPDLSLEHTMSARGECRRNVGLHSWIAAVEIIVSPSDSLEVDDSLSLETRQTLESADWYNQIVFGVLDVMLTDPIMPVRNFKLKIVSAEIDPIHASGTAFRLAAREAAKTVVAQFR